MTQPPLFGKPDSSPPPQARSLTGLDAEKATWTRYRPQHRNQCAECVLVLHENKGVGPAVRAARWRLKTGRDVFLLCESHARLRRGETPI